MSDDSIRTICLTVFLTALIGFMFSTIMGVAREDSFKKCLQVMEKRPDVSCTRGEQ